MSCERSQRRILPRRAIAFIAMAIMRYAVLGTACAPLLHCLDQFILASPRSLNRVLASAGGKSGNVTSAWWQVTLMISYHGMWVPVAVWQCTLRTAIVTWSNWGKPGPLNTKPDKNILSCSWWQYRPVRRQVLCAIACCDTFRDLICRKQKLCWVGYLLSQENWPSLETSWWVNLLFSLWWL